MAPDTIAALEAIDGKTFVAQHLQRTQAGGSSADQTVVPLPHAASIENSSRASES
jgi:hypothetical protein